MSRAYSSGNMPPDGSIITSPSSNNANAQKRKYEDTTSRGGENEKRKKHKKTRDNSSKPEQEDSQLEAVESNDIYSSTGNRSKTERPRHKSKTNADSTSTAGNVLEKYSITKFAKTHGTDPEARPSKRNGEIKAVTTEENNASGKSTFKKDKRSHVEPTTDSTSESSDETTSSDDISTDEDTSEDGSSEDSSEDDSNENTSEDDSSEDESSGGSDSDEGESQADEDIKATSKHSGLLSKFQRSRETAAKTKSTTQEEEEIIPDELHGLEPLPQPLPIQTVTSKPTYSTLPSWLANPDRVSPLEKKSFDELDVSPRILQNLKGQSMVEAFSVQAAVLPLLLKGTTHYNGDVCISAATGSGKTLAYVLPMIQALMGYATTRLRGLIVVPTRELVKQAREVCEICASGTGLKIASAVGSRSLKDEADILIEQHQNYSSKSDQDTPMDSNDWSKLDLRTLHAESDRNTLSTTFQSKVDILICTPGRLVEHLRSTKGFHLNHLEWLVIDEADRLMNESFQEWVEVVIPALQSRNAEDQKLTNNILQAMKMPLPIRNLQKVVLSATFSSDISKLNSLQLRNPRLLVVGDHQAVTDGENEADVQGMLTMPTTLTEFAIPVGDSLQKPLYLLQLLKGKLQKKVSQYNIVSEDSDDSDTSDSSSDASDSSSDSSDSSDSSSSDDSTSSDETSDSEDDVKIEKHNARCLVFAGSTESAQRLYRLLTILDPSLTGIIGTLTKSSASSSRKAVSLLRRGKIKILIATDRASRGLDIPELDHVVSYDIPSSVTTYVHRVGRTARAGRTGQAWTLIAHREARWFWNEIGKGMGETKISRSDKVQKLTLALDESEEMMQRYETALKALGEEVQEKKAA